MTTNRISKIGMVLSLHTAVFPLALLAAGLELYSQAAAAEETVGISVLEGARLIDGTGRPALADSVLILERGRIRAVGRMGSVRYPEGAPVVEMRGKTIMPALINLHGHLGLTVNGLDPTLGSYTEENIRKQLGKYLDYGVARIVSLGTDEELIYKLREAERAGHLQGARFYTAGRGFGVAGGYPPRLPNLSDRYRPQSPEEARAEVRELALHRADFVKIWVDDDLGRLPKMKPEIFRAIIDEAHRHHLRVIAHVFYLADAKALAEAGVDGFGHSIRDQAVDRELIDAMKAHDVFLIPTLVRDEATFIYAEGPVWLDDAFFQAGLDPRVLPILKSPPFANKFRSNADLAKFQAAFTMAKKNLKTLFDAGVKVGLGTDSGPPLRFQGYFEHRELQLMVESGLTPMQAIVCGTRNAAEILGASSEFGTLEPGQQADFLILDANPLDDIHNTERLSGVRQSGNFTPPLAAR